MKLTPRFLGAVAAVALLMQALPADAQRSAGRFGLEDPALVERFEVELNAILLSPPAPGTRGAPAEPDEEIERILGTDLGLRKAWRADPAETLALIERIRSAGGLQK